MTDSIPLALSKEYRDELVQRFETHDTMMVPISRLDGLTLLRQIDWQEKQLDWLAIVIAKYWGRRMNSGIQNQTVHPNYESVDYWREMAREAVEQNNE